MSDLHIKIKKTQMQVIRLWSKRLAEMHQIFSVSSCREICRSVGWSVGSFGFVST